MHTVSRAMLLSPALLLPMPLLMLLLLMLAPLLPLPHPHITSLSSRMRSCSSR